VNQIAKDFFTRCFAPGDTIALLLRRENGERPTQRVVRLEQALAPRYIGWLAHENANSANIYVAANPLRSGSRHRTKESIAEVRHLYIDIDADGEARAATLLASDAVPAPTAVLSTSPNKYQVLWRVDGFDFEQQEATLLSGSQNRCLCRGHLGSRKSPSADHLCARYLGVKQEWFTKMKAFQTLSSNRRQRGCNRRCRLSARASRQNRQSAIA
jgi:hypothetical protein